MASRIHLEDFAGGTVDKNPPANAGDPGSVPALGRLHMVQSNLAQVPQLLKPTCLEPVFHKRSQCNEKPAHRNEESACLPQLQKVHVQQRRPSTTKNIQINLKIFFKFCLIKNKEFTQNFYDSGFSHCYTKPSRKSQFWSKRTVFMKVVVVIEHLKKFNCAHKIDHLNHTFTLHNHDCHPQMMVDFFFILSRNFVPVKQ